MENVQAELESLGDVNKASPEARRRYIELRNREATLKTAAESEQAEADEAEALSVGSRLRTTDTGALVGEKPDFVKQREAQQTSTTTTTAPAADTVSDSARMNALRGSLDTGEVQTDNTLEQRVKARMAGRDRARQSEMQQGEENLAYLKAKGAPNTPEGRGRYAQALVRAERRAKGGQGSGLSDEQIRGQEERALARERRTPAEKEAAQARDTAVVADLNKKADEVRAKEQAANVKTPSTTPGTRTASASQTAPKSYRI